MIGELPKNLNVNGKEWAIRSDFRVALHVFQAMNDVDLDEAEKITVMLDLVYENFNDMSENDYAEAMKQAVWYLNGGKPNEDYHGDQRIMDWEQDEQMIFSAVNKVANKETRECEYIHWWTFLGYFSEIGEGLFSTVISIRNKKNKGRKLEKHELDFYRNNKSTINLKTRYTEEEKEEIERLKKLFD